MTFVLPLSSKKISLLFHIPIDKIHDLRLRTGTSVNYSVTDEVVMNMQNDSLFVMELIIHDHAVEKYILLLKPYTED